MNISSTIICLALFIFLSCGPKEKPVECLPDSINKFDGTIFTGYINLCNAQGTGDSSNIYETGICSLAVESDSLIFVVFSTNPGFHYYYSDTLTYDCVVYEEMSRSYNLLDFKTNDDMGVLAETERDLHLIILDANCPNSSFFEAHY